jgi:hypothetical protein
MADDNIKTVLLRMVMADRIVPLDLVHSIEKDLQEHRPVQQWAKQWTLAGLQRMVAAAGAGGKEPTHPTTVNCMF